jgi:hypothetical protein
MLAAGPAAALVIQPGEQLEAPFSLSGPASGANTLTFRLTGVSAVDVSTMTVQLFDGATLLASVGSVPVSGIAAFTDTGSLWTTNAVSADLASVRAGTIVGKIVVLPDFLSSSATLTAGVSLIENISLTVGNGTGDSTIVPISGVLLVGDAVPEPGPAALLFAMLGMAALSARPPLRRLLQ